MGGSERTNGLGKGEWWGGEGAGRGAMLDTSPDKIYINITRDQTELFFLKFFSMDLSLWSDGGIGWGGGKTLKFGADFWGGGGVTHDFNHFFQQSTNASKYIGFETFDRKEKKKKRGGFNRTRKRRWARPGCFCHSFWVVFFSIVCFYTFLPLYLL